jgi:hypothetical protein
MSGNGIEVVVPILMYYPVSVMEELNKIMKHLTNNSQATN